MSAPRGDRATWVSAYVASAASGLVAWLSALRGANAPPDVRYQQEKTSSAVTRDMGPMLYIGQQIVKRMGKMGYPSKIAEHYRSPERQNSLNTKKKRVTNAGAYQSPHQFYEAVDIVHATLNWDAPPEYWDALAVCVRAIEADLRVKLTHGHYWRMVDSAHIELTSWRDVRKAQIDNYGHNYKPTQTDLKERWRVILPSVKAGSIGI